MHTCPHCAQAVNLNDSTPGKTTSCPLCGKEFVIPDPNPSQNIFSTSIQNEDENFFSILESILKKMIVGIPKFIFCEAPRKILLVLERLFPWLIKFIRVFILFTLWIFLLAWPIFFAKQCRIYICDQLSIIDPLTLDISYPWILLCWLWVGLAVLGSLWGLLYVTIRKRRQKIKIWQNKILNWTRKDVSKASA
jgi:hypothetical protein